jgi:hypothetical protein
MIAHTGSGNKLSASHRQAGALSTIVRVSGGSFNLAPNKPVAGYLGFRTQANAVSAMALNSLFTSAAVLIGLTALLVGGEKK